MHFAERTKKVPFTIYLESVSSKGLAEVYVRESETFRGCIIYRRSPIIGLLLILTLTNIWIDELFTKVTLLSPITDDATKASYQGYIYQAETKNGNDLCVTCVDIRSYYPCGGRGEQVVGRRRVREIEERGWYEEAVRNAEK